MGDRTVARILRWLGLAVLLLLAALAPARAQSLESVLRPGDLIRDHAKWDDECAKCHVRFNREAQNGLCMDCHKDVGHDVRTRGGYHGRVEPQPCRACHTDHKGRDARIVNFDPARFDHAKSDYALRGKHADVACAKCHTAGKKYRDAAQDCNACHRKDDVHKGSLGAQCADCHNENDWKLTRFDHSKTKFALTGKHLDTRCADCHRSAVYSEAPSACVACHRKDDDGARGHHGRFGEKCESCHGTKAWKPSTFQHDRDTRYPLRAAHRSTACADCHTGHLYRDKLAAECNACHRKDDVHKGSLGAECQACHQETRWKETTRFDHSRTKFALLGKHADVKCTDCHTKGSDYKVADTRCVACHRKDDKHRPTLGDRCEACHVERDWKDVTRFDHDKTRYALRGRHVRVKCGDCHRTADYRATPHECEACHRKDDKHEGQLGARCESCHVDADWKQTPSFDHARARFALTGRHVSTPCAKCHLTPRYRDAARNCIGCHREDDRHKATLGTECQDCHNTRDWRLWRFDHERQTGFVLDGAHKPLACARCHQAPAPPGKAAAEVGDTCLACHRKDDRHDGAFGARCEQCHDTSDWKRIRRRPGQAGVAAPTADPLGRSSGFARFARAAAEGRPS